MAEPLTSRQAEHRWSVTQFQQYARVMDAFQRYNVLGFFVGNENIASRNDSPVASCSRRPPET